MKGQASVILIRQIKMKMQINYSNWVSNVSGWVKII